MTVAERIRQNTSTKRGIVAFVGVAMAILVVLATYRLTYAALTWNVDVIAHVGARSALMLGVFLPLLSLAVIALRPRSTAAPLWACLCIGALIAASGPLLVLASGGTWDTPTFFARRLGAGRDLPLVQFAWIAWVPAALMLIGGVTGWVRGLRAPRQ